MQKNAIYVILKEKRIYMKKIFTLLLTLCVLSINTIALAFEDENIQIHEGSSAPVIHDDAPVWEEYVAPKYRNPRSDFSRGSSIAELAVGIILTELIITSPIGIPMTVHGTTKIKMISYNNRKTIFDDEIPKAQTIEDDAQRKLEYQRILNKCHLKESTRQHYLKKEAKNKAKAEKKAKKLEK